MEWFKPEENSLDKNEFYFPNMCHVCHCFGEKVVNLKRCGACAMISYCCKEHQTKDWPKHKQFCKAICKIKNDFKVDSVFQSIKGTFSKISLDSWEKYYVGELIMYRTFAYEVNSIMKIVTLLLNRELTKPERQMLNCPRLCAICYESKPELLINCKKCPQSSFCKEHLNDPRHDTECIKFISCFNCENYTNFKFMLLHSIFFFEPKICESLLFDIIKSMVVPHFPTVKKLHSSMAEFVESRFLTDLENTSSNINDTLTEEMRLVYNDLTSDYYSGPLTLLFAIEKLGINLHSMVIHVVGSSPTFEQLFSGWEMMFHFSQQLRELKLILIGPEMRAKKDLHSTDETLDLCGLCNEEKRKIFIDTKKAMYDEYCEGDSYLKPDMIVCFNPGFEFYDTWTKSVQLFNKEQCPLLVTSFHSHEANVNKGFIDSIFPNCKCVYSDKNPFTTLDYSRLSFYFPVAARNQFMSVYEFLDTKKSSN